MNFFRYNPRYTLFLAALSLIAGEVAAFAVPPLGSVWGALALAAATFALAFYGWRLGHLWPAVVFLVGATLAARSDSILARLTSIPESGPAHVRTFDLVVREVNPPRVSPQDPLRAGSARRSFRASACGASIVVVISLPPGANAPEPGELWRCRGWLSPPPKGRSRFDAYRLWAHRPGDAVRLRPADPSSWSGRLRRLSEFLSERVAIGLSRQPLVADLHRAMLLGRRSSLPPEIRQMFVTAGTIHVFAISGLHVMIVAGALLKLALLCNIDVRRRGLLVIPLVFAYTIITGARPSAVRAAAMATLCFLAPMFGRRADLVAAWSAAAIYVYALSPERIFDVGCTLSFVVMLGIALWLRAFDASPNPPPAVLAQARLLDTCGHPRRAFALRWCASTLGRFRASFAVSLAAWAAGVPVAAHVFGRFTPGGLLANIAVLPLASVSVAIGMSALAIGCICPPLAVPLNNLAAVSTRLMVACSRLVGRLPGASVDVEPWSIGACIGWYALCLAAVLFLLWLRNRRKTDWMRRP